MSLPGMRAAVARILVDPEYRRAFFAAPVGEAEGFGLTAEEFGLLRQLDARKLGITSEGFSGKRLERVASAFPLALAALGATAPDAALRYLAQTAFPPDERAERETFLAYLRHAEAWPGSWRRCLLDLADAEAALAARGPPPPLPALRVRPDVTRPRRTALAVPVRFRGPVEAAIAAAATPGLPDDYPESPRECLVSREGNRLRIEPLDARRKALLEACDGARTMGELARGGDEGALDDLERWLRRGVLVDGAPP